MKAGIIQTESGGLYCCLHRGDANVTSNQGLVICQPYGMEYMRAHRCLYQIAEAVAETGIPVLRFDYSGTGDSGGTLDHIRWDQWQKDLRMAIEFLQHETGVEHVGGLGVRLGGTLVASALAVDHQLAWGLLWDPVIHGGRYCKRLSDWHQQWYAKANRVRSPENQLSEALGNERLGFEYPVEFAQQLESLRLSTDELKQPCSLAIGEEFPQHEADLAVLSTIMIDTIHLSKANWNEFSSLGERVVAKPYVDPLLEAITRLTSSCKSNNATDRQDVT